MTKEKSFQFTFIFIFGLNMYVCLLFSLETLDAPIVTLNLGSQLDPSNLMKGSDVYLECQITANPPQKRVEWFHNVR